VTALTRARRLQVLVDHGFGGLFAGLGLATVAVLAARLLSMPYLPWQLAGATVIVAVAVALGVGWLRRPAALEVAIRADLALRLKQRLSTAWEFMTTRGEDALAERLAAQAVKAGLPAIPGTVFPLRVNRWGRLAPLAATALLLASVVDPLPIAPSQLRELDEQVAGEGRRLGAYGRAMQERAERDELPRSARQAARIERLGARMGSGALSRSEALGQLGQLAKSLDAERMQALAESNIGAAPPRPGSAERAPAASGLNPGAMLDRLQRGALDSADTRALAERLDDLERSGIPRRQVDDALGRHRAGADAALKEILEQLARIDRAGKEGRELQSAREQVSRAQANLGNGPAGTKGGAGALPDLDWGDDERGERGAKGAGKPGVDARPQSEALGEAAHGGTRGDSSVAIDREPPPFLPDTGRSGPILEPEGRAGEGEEYASQGRILPRPNRPRGENVEMRREFVPQVEEALSSERYPDRHKEFIRRYFLNLSRGERPSQEQSPGTRSVP
jgi:hypothetical protein